MNATTTLERPTLERPGIERSPHLETAAAVKAPVHATLDRQDAADRIATEMFEQQPDWVTFFREVLGVEGLVRKLFASPAELAAFEQTPEYAHIQQMLARLRERSALSTNKEPTRVITVRLPKTLHESLLAQAHDRRTSMNQLCISKLLQVLGGECQEADHAA